MTDNTDHNLGEVFDCIILKKDLHTISTLKDSLGWRVDFYTIGWVNLSLTIDCRLTL